MRECKKCHKSLPITDFRPTYNKGGTGRRKVCKRCGQLRRSEIYRANPEPIRAKGRENYNKHKDRYREYNKIYDIAYPERVKERNRRADLKRKNKKSRLKQRSKYREENREKLRAIAREYYATHKAEDRSRRELRRVRLKGITIRDLTHAQWKERLAEFDYHCAYCWTSNVVLTQDHLVPISKGGHHTLDNVVPACVSCNARKNNRSMLEVLKLVGS